MSRHVNCIKEIALAFARMEYNEPVIEVVIDDYEQIGFPEVREIKFIAERLSGFKPYFLLLKLGQNVRITTEGKRAAVNYRDNSHKKASAVVIMNEVQQSDVDHIASLASVPTRSFRTREEALGWLHTLPLNS